MDLTNYFSITNSTFRYEYFLDNPWISLSYGLLIVALLLFYVLKDIKFRVVILLFPLFMGWYTKQLEWQAFFVVLGLGGLFYFALEYNHKWVRGICFLAAVAVAIFLPQFSEQLGFKSWEIVRAFNLSKDAPRYGISINYLVPLMGMFFLMFSNLSIANAGQAKPVFKSFIPIAGICALVLIPTALALRYVNVDVKWTNFFFIWAFQNLFFTCLYEEFIFRGMILKFFLLRFQQYTAGALLALLVSAVLFAIAHHQGGEGYMFLALIAGCFYGYAFMKTERIEACILTHFVVNSIHFWFFSYPALKTAVN